MHKFRLILSAGVLAIAFPAAASAQQAVSPEQAQQLIDTLKQRNDQLRALSAEIQAMRTQVAEAEALTARVAASEKALAVAATRNRELVEIGEAILADYEKMDLGKRVGAAEPLTQLYRVRLQNKLQEFHDQIAAHGFYPERDVQAAPPASTTP